MNETHLYFQYTDVLMKSRCLSSIQHVIAICWRWDLFFHGSTHVNHKTNTLIRLPTHQNVGYTRGMYATEVLVDVMVSVR